MRVFLQTMAKPSTEFQFDPDSHIVIAQKVYDREGLGDEIKNAISHINYADQELASMEANLRVYRTGRDQMVKLLVDRLETDDTPVIALIPDAFGPEAEG